MINSVVAPFLALILLNVPGSTALYPPSSEAAPGLAAALARAKASDRLVLVDFGANWCVWCRGLSHVFHHNDAIRELLRARYEVTYVNVEQFEANLDLAERLGVRGMQDTGIPILVILKPDGSVVERKDAGDFERRDGSGYSEEAVLRFLEKHACASEPARLSRRRAGG